MPVFDNLSSTGKYIEKAIIASLEHEVSSLVEDTLRKYLYERLYSYSPKVYERTYELMNSITRSKAIKTANGYEIEVYFDTDKIHGNSLTGQHYEYGKDISEYIPWMAEDGVIQPLTSNHRGGFVEATIEELGSIGTHIDALRKALRNKGVNAI